uniref:Dynein heavy chain region D6 P-loop domain-containing protein n=1 Tax=Monopterus albus TaxID=43700 RepID=A0A3Q3JPM2_MONAL
LNDMGRIDSMYQFSLDAYINLFSLSIDNSKRSHKLEERITSLNDYHTYAVYRYMCRGLFEVHKLLFSFQICAKIQEAAGKLNMDEYSFFLRGGLVRKHRTHTMFTWVSDLNKCNELQKMLIVRSLRPDRVSFCITSFIVNNLGSRFVEPPVLNMKAVSVVEESTSRTPLIFVLSPGVDPTGALLHLAEASGMSKHFHALSLGQGQAPIAKSMIEEGVKNGHWVFLANCHLSLSWMPDLDKLVEQLQGQEPHHSILHCNIVYILEVGVKSNMKRLYQLVTEAQFNRCSKPVFYRKLVFSLCFFHSILLERKKFLQLGWNIVYVCNDHLLGVALQVSENLLSQYLDNYEEIPWDALKYLIAGVNYGGHVTDDWDRRLLTTYISDYFCDALLEGCQLSSLSSYYIPHDGPQSSYKEYINMLPPTEHPGVFGQHPNADIASQIAETRMLFDTLLSLQPRVTSPTAVGARPSREDQVRARQNSIRGGLGLLSENTQLDIRSKISSLVELERGIKGLVVMSPNLEETFNCIYDARVPPLWEKAYPSQKPLAAWTRDLCQRVDQFARWAETARPPVLFWLSGFTFPNGFLTAVLQSCARQHNVRGHSSTCT